MENCEHSGSLQAAPGSGFRCPRCGARLDPGGVERWVREAEKERDEAYALVEDDGFARIVLEERQREVYRRRKVLYGLRNARPVADDVRPEMILVSYDMAEDSYGCRIFYKEPRPAWVLEWVGVEADLDSILALRSHPDPNVRLASGKAEEFHALRNSLLGQDTYPPLRRVFYQNEL